MKSLFARLFRRHSALRTARSALRRRRPLFEALENRSLLAGISFGTPFNLGAGVNSAVMEEGPTITADGLNLLFHRSPSPFSAEIFEATRPTTDVPFGTAISVGAGVNFGSASAHPAISHDGLTLVYSAGIAPGERLYQATRASRTEPFGTADSLGNLVGNQALESPSLSADGLTLFFTVWDSAHGTNDIYQATRNNVADEWGNVVMLSSAINVPGYNDAMPSLSSDGLRLFFNSNRPGGFGAFDLYVATRPSLQSPWEPAVNLGSQVNTASDDKGACISTDGSLLYFHSNRPGGAGQDDLYAVTVGYDAPAAPTISISDATATEGSTAYKFIDEFVTAGSGGLNGPREVVFGPDGYLYVATGLTGQSQGDDSNKVLRFDGQTGAFVDVAFQSGDSQVFFDLPWAMQFGPDGKLYVSGRRSDNIVRYDPAKDTVQEYVAAGSGVYKPAGLTFGSDGNLYVANSDLGASDTSASQDRIVRFQGPSGINPGQFIDVFVPSGNGLDNANGIAFSGGSLYVCNTRGNSVLRYDATSGDFQSAFVQPNSGGVNTPSFLTFRPDGYLYLNSQSTDQLLRYNASTGAFADVVVPAGSGGLDVPTGFTFDETGNLVVASHRPENILRYSPASRGAFTVTISSPSSVPVQVNYATATDSAGASDFVGVSGTITFARGQTSRTILVQTVPDDLVEGNETFVVNLSSPVGGVIVDGQGVGTIVDNDIPPTKFYVVNDGSPDQTYEYGATGAPVENYAINSGNTAPRGAASTVAGDKVWVVDANRKVYVYNASGTLLGSWSAGSLGSGSNMQVQGIATNGTDIWIVQNNTDPKKADIVYRYMNAASRLSGSQNAASNFPLNSNNKNPTDIVTDGTHLWVVDDSTIDKVFRYTLANPAVGLVSWTITAGGGSPTGITLDPSGGADMWIVDNNSDSVYLLSGARNAANNSSVPATQPFALATGNTNPQGIADPPAGSTSGVPVGRAASHSSADDNASYDTALFSVLSELDSLLGKGVNKKRG